MTQGRGEFIHAGCKCGHRHGDEMGILSQSRWGSPSRPVTATLWSALLSLSSCRTTSRSKSLVKKRDLGVVLGLDQPGCCCLPLTFFIEGHERIGQICGGQNHKHVVLVKSGMQRHGSRCDGRNCEAMMPWGERVGKAKRGAAIKSDLETAKVQVTHESRL